MAAVYSTQFYLEAVYCSASASPGLDSRSESKYSRSNCSNSPFSALTPANAKPALRSPPPVPPFAGSRYGPGGSAYPESGSAVATPVLKSKTGSTTPRGSASTRSFTQLAF